MITTIFTPRNIIGGFGLGYILFAFLCFDIMWLFNLEDIDEPMIVRLLYVWLSLLLVVFVSFYEDNKNEKQT